MAVGKFHLTVSSVFNKRKNSASSSAVWLPQNKLCSRAAESMLNSFLFFTQFQKSWCLCISQCNSVSFVSVSFLEAYYELSFCKIHAFSSMSVLFFIHLFIDHNMHTNDCSSRYCPARGGRHRVNRRMTTAHINEYDTMRPQEAPCVVVHSPVPKGDHCRPLFTPI